MLLSYCYENKFAVIFTNVLLSYCYENKFAGTFIVMKINVLLFSL